MITITQTGDIERTLQSDATGIEAFFPFTVAVTELPTTTHAVSVNWGDGNVENLTYAADGKYNPSHTFLPGAYLIQVTVTNNKFPTPEKQLATWYLDVENVVATPPPARYFVGPILPLDTGEPGYNDWILHGGEDLQVLKSSVQSILGTELGERLNRPTFGWRRKSVLFNDLDSAADLILEEITAALAQWEPRVQVISVKSEARSDRAVDVFVHVASKLGSNEFNLVLPIER